MLRKEFHYCVCNIHDVQSRVFIEFFYWYCRALLSAETFWVLPSFTGQSGGEPAIDIIDINTALRHASLLSSHAGLISNTCQLSEINVKWTGSGRCYLFKENCSKPVGTRLKCF